MTVELSAVHRDGKLEGVDITNKFFYLNRFHEQMVPLKIRWILNRSDDEEEDQTPPRYPQYPLGPGSHDHEAGSSQPKSTRKSLKLHFKRPMENSEENPEEFPEEILEALPAIPLREVPHEEMMERNEEMNPNAGGADWAYMGVIFDGSDEEKDWDADPVDGVVINPGPEEEEPSDDDFNWSFELEEGSIINQDDP